MKRKTATAKSRTGVAAVSDRRAPVPSALRIKSILGPIDFSALSTKALDYAVPLAQQFGAKPTLLHVVEAAATPGFAKSFLLMMGNDKKYESNTNKASG
jgi:nucleotide-binding universal stress UspA family protein